MRQKEQGDEEAQGIDETFIDAYVPLSSLLLLTLNHLQIGTWTPPYRRVGYRDRPPCHVPHGFYKYVIFAYFFGKDIDVFLL